MSEAALAPAAPHRGLTWDEVKGLVLDSVTSPHSKRAYARAISEFARWAGEQQTAGQGSPFGKALVQRYCAALEEKGLAPSSINVRLAALRKRLKAKRDRATLSACRGRPAAGRDRFAGDRKHSAARGPLGHRRSHR